MKQEKIEEVAKHLGHEPLYVGYRNRDSQLNLGAYESQHFNNPADAFSAAKCEATAAGYTRLEYGVRAEIGPDVVVTEVDGFTAST